MRVPQLGWYIGILAFVAAAVSSVIANRWSEEPLERIRVINAVSTSSPEPLQADDSERMRAVGHAVWHTSADGQRIAWPGAGRGVNGETVANSTFLVPAESQVGFNPVEGREASDLGQSLSPQVARATWGHVQSGPPAEPLPKSYPRTSRTLTTSSQSGAAPTISSPESEPVAQPDAIESASRPKVAPVSMIDQTSLVTAREETLSAANRFPSSHAPQPNMQGDEYHAGQTQSLIGDSQAKPLQPTAIHPDDSGRDRARALSLAVNPDQRFDEPNNGPAAPIQNGRVENGFEPTRPAENRLTPQPHAADADPTGRAVHRTHRTGADESLWSISLAYYGRGSYFRALYEHNRRRIVRPDQLEPNVLIEIPSTGELRHWYPALCPAP